MIAVFRHLKISGALYQGASDVIEAIDGLVAPLIGEREYFHTRGTSATEGQFRAVKGKGRRGRGEKAMEGQGRLSIKAMVGWIKRFGDSNGLVESDASDLVERFGDQAYYEARDRAQRAEP
jgi:hypothetical protein